MQEAIEKRKAALMRIKLVTVIKTFFAYACNTKYIYMPPKQLDGQRIKHASNGLYARHENRIRNNSILFTLCKIDNYEE